MFRVVTANLYNCHVDTEALGRLIEEEQPDFMALQELSPAAAGVIAARLPHGLLLPSEDTTGMGIAAREPVTVRRHPLPHRDALVADAGFDLWSVHLANPVDAPPPWRARRDQVEALASALDTGRPTLLVGDLNATPLWPAYRRLNQRLDDGVAEWARREGIRPQRTWTYHGWTPPLLRIDHALVRGLRVVHAHTRHLPGSDHRPLIADVEPEDR